MKRWIAGLVVLMIPSVAAAQADPLRIYTTPGSPSREVLTRLNLAQGWKIKIPTLGKRDGLFSVQLIPGRDPARDNPQLVVQTLYGTVIQIDAETGDTLWRTSVSLPYWSGQPVGYNSKSIFTSRRDKMHVLNRTTGRERVYTVDKVTKLPTFGFTLESSPSTAPVADEDMVFVAFGKQIVAYTIPIFEVEERIRESEFKGDTIFKKSSLQPEFSWGYRLDGNAEALQAPLTSPGQLGLVGTNGTFLSINPFYESPIRLRYDYKFHGGVMAGMGQHGSKAYIGSDDATLYALEMPSGRLLWRLLSGGTILRKVEVTDTDVYIKSEGRGLFRVDRLTGQEKWLNRTAERFLATNQKYVYAADRLGRLLVLDQARGTQLAQYDLSDWAIPLSNELTDRIYYANHDGQVLCLHHRDFVSPLRTKTFDVKVLEKKEPKGDKEKEPEKDKEDKEKGAAKVGFLVDHHVRKSLVYYSIPTPQYQARNQATLAWDEKRKKMIP